jgi:hypothetical protein
MNGLVLCLDAGNTKSYPGSGTTWTDLSGRGNNGTFGASTAAPTYNSENGGYLSFDGGDNIQIANSSSISPSSQMTVSCWCYLTANSQTMIRKNPSDYLMEWGVNETNNAGTILQWRIETSTGVYFIYSTSALNLNSWYNLVGTYSSGVGGNIYANSSLLASTSVSTNTGTIIQSNSYLRLGNYTTETFRGRISQVSIYNRALTVAEIQQNFNALRGRFGV